MYVGSPSSKNAWDDDESSASEEDNSNSISSAEKNSWTSGPASQSPSSPDASVAADDFSPDSSLVLASRTSGSSWKSEGNNSQDSRATDSGGLLHLDILDPERGNLLNQDQNQNLRLLQSSQHWSSGITAAPRPLCFLYNRC